MFKELLNVWKGEETFLDETIRDFEEMLQIAQQMYEQVTSALFEGHPMGDLKKELYKKDAIVNHKEQNIRQKIMTQLAASAGPEEPIASCLILMSISKDVERLGDYAKNFLEVFEVKPHLGKKEPYYGRLVQIRDCISRMFDEVREAYHASDKNLAKQCVKISYEHQKLCDQSVRELLLAQPEESRVAYALLNRFFKRILAHLGNIATSVFMPVTRIDFFDERLREEEVKKL